MNLLKYTVPILLLIFLCRLKTLILFLSVLAITKLQHAKEYTIKVANLMPEENYLFKPTPGEMTFGEQLLHLCSNMDWLCSSYLNGREKPHY